VLATLRALIAANLVAPAIGFLMFDARRAGSWWKSCSACILGILWYIVDSWILAPIEAQPPALGLVTRLRAQIKPVEDYFDLYARRMSPPCMMCRWTFAKASSFPSWARAAASRRSSTESQDSSDHRAKFRWRSP